MLVINRIFSQVTLEGETHLERSFSLKGRLNRAKYFWYSLINFVVSLSAYQGITIAFAGVQHTSALDDTSASVLSTLFCVYMTMSIVLTVRRLHDLDRSGWQWWLGFVPLYSFYQGLILLFEKGTDGPNRYGENPLQTEHVVMAPKSQACKAVDSRLAESYEND